MGKSLSIGWHQSVIQKICKHGWIKLLKVLVLVEKPQLLLYRVEVVVIQLMLPFISVDNLHCISD